MTDPTTRDPAADELTRALEGVTMFDSGVLSFPSDRAHFAVSWCYVHAPALLAEVDFLRERVRAVEEACGSQRARAEAAEKELTAQAYRHDQLSRNETAAREAAEQVAREAVALLVDCNTVANVRGQLGVSDCIDNDGQPYQSQHLADFLAHHGARTGDANG